MTRSLKQLLDERHVNSNTVQQAARYYLAERTDDLTPDEMRQQLVEATGDATAVDTVLSQLRQSPLLLENASLFLLASAWEEPDERERIDRIVNDAQGKLPVIEVGVIAIVAIYGMYLIATGSIKSTTRTTIRRPDRTLEETETVEYAGPQGPLSAIVKLFGWQGPE
jgi:hypothetical protein